MITQQDTITFDTNPRPPIETFFEPLGISIEVDSNRRVNGGQSLPLGLFNSVCNPGFNNDGIGRTTQSNLNPPAAGRGPVQGRTVTVA
ncbi:MAG: hypothetical protein HC890_05140, partial [Chloroflexaceae bacterium]|nr:hypothetical protein [Chloroflexaceae bacterium]